MLFRSNVSSLLALFKRVLLLLFTSFVTPDSPRGDCCVTRYDHEVVCKKMAVRRALGSSACVVVVQAKAGTVGKNSFLS